MMVNFLHSCFLKNVIVHYISLRAVCISLLSQILSFKIGKTFYFLPPENSILYHNQRDQLILRCIINADREIFLSQNFKSQVYSLCELKKRSMSAAVWTALVQQCMPTSVASYCVGQHQRSCHCHPSLPRILAAFVIVPCPAS